MSQFVREALEVHAQAAGILEKQLGMRAAGDQATGFFLVHVGDELAARLGDRAKHVGAGDQHRKITNVGFVLLLEVDVQERLGDQSGGEAWPRPVLLRSMMASSASRNSP